MIARTVSHKQLISKIDNCFPAFCICFFAGAFERSEMAVPIKRTGKQFYRLLIFRVRQIAELKWLTWFVAHT